MMGYFLLLVLLAAAMQPADSQTACTDWDTTEFDEARADWSEKASACYTFSYTFSGLSGGEDAKAVAVRGDVVVSGEVGKTINDFFEMIGTKCAVSCRCANKYAGVGYPLQIFIDESEFKAGEELIYKISKYEAVDCDSIPASKNDGSDPVDDANQDIFSDPVDDEEEVSATPDGVQDPIITGATADGPSEGGSAAVHPR
jgi:hypothetical protein